MATSEMSPQKSFLPPPLYSAGAGAATAVRPVTLYAPNFLVSLQDEVERSHRRQAFWTSVLVHLVALVLFVNGAKFLSTSRVVIPAKTEVMQNREYTFLVLPPDLQKNVPRPHTAVLSDENRLATSREAVIDRKVLQHILAASQKGNAGPKVHQLLAKSLPARAPVSPSSHARGEVAAAAPPALIRTGQPELTQVPAARPAVPSLSARTSSEAAVPPAASASQSAGNMVEGLSAAKSTAASQSNVDVISDTMGVDFGPYLSRILRAVRVNWYSRIPEAARAPLMKKGKVSIQFDILKTGQIAAMQVVGTSGDPSLDGAAIGGINGSGPFPPLPPEFQGQYLALRFHFFYNPDTNDLR